MHVREAIRQRRAVRAFTEEPVAEGVVRELLDAAIQAPSAINLQPWAFVVVQDQYLLKKISDRAKLLLLHTELPPELRDMVASPGFNIFYDAGTLVLICAKPVELHPEWDCCFAAENLMLAAREMGLGTCVVGFAWPALAQAEIRNELDIPDEYTVVTPIIVGHPKEFPPAPPRRAPEILSWARSPVATG